MDQGDAPNLEEFRPWPTRAKKGGGLGHVGPHGDRPHGKLVPRKQVTGKGEQESQDEENHPDDPVELTGGFVAARHEDPEHVEHHHDYHGMGAPAMHLPHDAEGDLLPQIHHVGIGIFHGGTVIKHQQDARKGQNEKKEEAQASRAPSVAQFNPAGADFRGMQVEEDIPQHDQDPLAVGIRDPDAKDGLLDLRFKNALFKVGKWHNSVGPITPSPRPF